MVRTYQPGGLFSAGVDPIRLQAALQQQRPQFKPQAVRMLSAPTTVIQEKNPYSLGKGMEGLAAGIKSYRKQGREEDARAALEGLYAQPAGVSGPEPGPNTFRPGAAQLGRVAAQHVGTKAGAHAGALFAGMQAQDDLLKSYKLQQDMRDAAPTDFMKNLIRAGIDPQSPRGQDLLAAKSRGSLGVETWGKVPQDGTDADGKAIKYLVSNWGNTKIVGLPDGATITPKAIRKVDLGASIGFFSPGGVLLHTVPKGVPPSSSTVGGVRTIFGGTNRDGSAPDPQTQILPATPEQAATFQTQAAGFGTSIRLLEELVTHPQFSNVVGLPESIPGGMLNLFDTPVPGAPENDFMARHRQIQGQNFLQAFTTLKGGGQITEVEGRKATEAISRLTMITLSEKDYRAAVKELQGILRSGLSRLTAEAKQRGVEISSPLPVTPPGNASGWSIKPSSSPAPGVVPERQIFSAPKPPASLPGRLPPRLLTSRELR